jgi:hypothetical protein
MISIDEEFRFGKYKGFAIKDVWTGPISNHQSIIREYFTSFFEFLKTDYRQITSFILPNNYQSRNGKKEGTTKSSEPFGDFSVITSDNYLIIEASDLNLVNRINCEIKEIYSSQFDGMQNFKMTKGADGYEIISPACLKINADPHYVLWCVKKIDNFCFSQEDIEKLQILDCYFLRKITISEIKPDILAYEPIYTATRFKISERLVKINSDKIESNNQQIESTNYNC